MQSRRITEVAFSLVGGADGTHAPASIAGERAGRSSLEANRSTALDTGTSIPGG
jgi:hypothetical protein